MSSIGDLKVLISIVARGRGEDVVEFLRERNVYSSVKILGKGTAAFQISDLLGIGDSKKDVVITVIDGEREKELLTALGEEFDLAESHKGIAFTIDINSIGSRLFFNYCKSKTSEN